MTRPRFRDLGWPVGTLPAGLLNSITDVPGVRVGQATLISGSGPLQRGVGPVRTGVTVILPHGENLFQHKTPAAVHTINGFGKVCGFEQVRELGVIEAPIALTNTLNVGRVLDALVEWMLRQNPEIGVTAATVNIVVGETNDGYLNDIQGRHVGREAVWAALDGARGGAVEEGAVGAGTGTVCYGWKGGIGTASRVLPVGEGRVTLGALVQTNFGRPPDLTILGVPVGRFLLPPGVSPPPDLSASDQGSVMVVLATDAPLEARQLHRLCVRAAAGLARTGSYFGHGSGDFAIAFSTAGSRTASTGPATAPGWAGEGDLLELLFRAVVESVEEAVLNSLCRAGAVTGRDEHRAEALPVDQVVELLKRFRG